MFLHTFEKSKFFVFGHVSYAVRFKLHFVCDVDLIAFDDRVVRNVFVRSGLCVKSVEFVLHGVDVRRRSIKPQIAVEHAYEGSFFHTLVQSVERAVFENDGGRKTIFDSHVGIKVGIEFIHKVSFNDC